MVNLVTYTLILLVADGVRLREERRRDGPLPPGSQTTPPQPQQQQRSLTSRRSSTDSSEDGFNLNVRDLKVWQFNLTFLPVVDILPLLVGFQLLAPKFYC